MSDRREFPRVQAPVLCRPVGKPLFRRRQPVDMSEGGMRLYADEAPDVGDRLELELTLPSTTEEVVCTVEVVWVDELAADAPAKYDVGVKYVDVKPAVRERLASVLKPD